jgi:hypothetical protein
MKQPKTTGCLILALALTFLIPLAGCGSTNSRSHKTARRPTAAQRAQQLRAANYGEAAIRATLKAEGYTPIPKPPAHEVTDADGHTCMSDVTKFGLCPDNPYFGKTPAKAHAARLAKARVAARARRAYLRRVNTWHRGYFPVQTDTYDTDPGAYAKWIRTGSCQDFAEYGCWHVEVIVRDGCPSYVGVEANEYRGNAVVSDLLDNNGTGLPPKTRVIFELDATQAGTTANDLKVQCD